jgi:hypothetical protein
MPVGVSLTTHVNLLVIQQPGDVRILDDRGAPGVLGYGLLDRQQDGPPPDAANSFGRGYRVILDKDGLIARLRLEEVRLTSPQPPAAHEFLNLVNDFWYHTVWSAKHLRRGEVWWAKGGVE